MKKPPSGIIELPDDILKAVNRGNWEYLWKHYMTTYEVRENKHDIGYIWSPAITRQFIKKLLNDKPKKRIKRT